VLSLNLDQFKETNETLGYIVANKLLQEVASRLTSLLRKADTIARFAGDQFGLLLPSLVRLEHADTVARKILEAFHKPFEFEGHSINITASIGVAIYPEDGQSADGLVKNANAAMCRAKEQGRDNYQRFNRSKNSPDPGLSADDI
jgi:diguanylate cyclase (GGDEF)-like protein